MIGKLGGAKAEAAFLRLLESGWFRLVDLTEYVPAVHTQLMRCRQRHAARFHIGAA
ncbi:hypothetical protein GCM10012278_84900 [Nonomuraea glycinis]|uniref:Uncharacterized protein n=1 Tax=Nonomuraea glycinis TaxID=2047744 RepID=A0A918E9S3_9ACTN|nr:hypothetical protein GCM10012278_84900 [Nonomuraea glycinis]